MKIHESAEMYLETILVLNKKKPQVRSIDIAEELTYKKSSVSVAMKNLRENGYIESDKDGYIKLTQKGKEVAETMLERHTLISGWLIRLGVDEKTAQEDACRMEHVVSFQSFEAIKRHVEKPNHL
jgi:DtxR family transcriptional regulator, Mn-dependent transcriptional regulator